MGFLLFWFALLFFGLGISLQFFLSYCYWHWITDLLLKISYWPQPDISYKNRSYRTLPWTILMIGWSAVSVNGRPPSMNVSPELVVENWLRKSWHISVTVYALWLAMYYNSPQCSFLSFFFSLVDGRYGQRPNGVRVKTIWI